MRLGKLILQLNEQIKPDRMSRIDNLIKMSEAAISDGYFKKAVDQKDISGRLASWIEELSSEIGSSVLDTSRTVSNKWGNNVFPYVNDAAEKLDGLNAPKGLSEKATKTWTDLARKAFGSKFDEEIEMIIKLTELRVKIAALPINKPEKTPSKAAMAASEREGLAMTCQICGGKYLAKKGKIAHHGYRRPGDGWQTASCFGAMAPPFEVSRDVLGQWIGIIENDLKRAKDQLQFASTSPELTLSGSFGYGSGFRKIDTSVNERNFAEVRADLINKLNASKGMHDTVAFVFSSFNDLRNNLVRIAKRRVNDLEEELKRNQSRYDKWKPVEQEG